MSFRNKIVIIISIGSLLFNLLLLFLFRREIKEMVVSWNAEEAQLPAITGSVLSYHTYKNNVKEISFFSRDTIGIPVLPSSLVIPPGKYRVEGKTYDLSKEGLYRFAVLYKYNIQRIVYANDPDALLSGIASIVSHGNSDNDQPQQFLTSEAKSRKLFLTCSKIAGWAQQLLAEQGVQSRGLISCTLEDWNQYNDAHNLIEVHRNDINKWVVYDLDMNRYFTSGDTLLSFLELVKKVKDHSYTADYLACDVRIDISNFKSESNYDFSFFSELMINDISWWYKRVLQVPMIYEDGKYYYYTHSAEEKIEQMGIAHEYMDSTVFVKKFYSTGNLNDYVWDSRGI
jgi:hypothetical protein